MSKRKWKSPAAHHLLKLSVIVLILVVAVGLTCAGSVLLSLLSDPSSIRTGLRDRYAAFGAAQAFLLDRLTPDWKIGALPDGASLDNLVAQSIPPSDKK